MKSRINSIVTCTLLFLSPLSYNEATAADKTETLRGTITLGTSGYGIRLENGQVIGFMGRGGNKVFTACHNGDACEITGIIAYNIKNPIFLTVSSVRKLEDTDRPAAGNPVTQQDNSTQAAPTKDHSETSPPFLLDSDSSQ